MHTDDRNMNFISATFFFFGLLTLTQLIITDAQAGAVCGSGRKKKCGGLGFDPNPVAEQLLGARCCSSAQFYLSEVKHKFGCTVWAGSRGPNRECMTSGTYAEAVTHCTNAGARLCTCNELMDKCAKGTGCGLNSMMIWCEP